MKKAAKTLALLAAILAIAMSASLSSCQSLPTSAQAKVRFNTTATGLPPDLEWSHIGKAHELINTTELVVVVSGWDNPMPDEEWATYQPPPPWRKNIERNLLFSSTSFMHSPKVPDGTTGDARYTIRELSGHSWIELAKPLSVDFIPPGQSTDMLMPSPGHLVVKTILKPQAMRWEGTIFRLTDNRGNYYVMHATETGTPTLDVVLPAGWSLEKIALDEPLVITPSEGGYYNIVGDCLGQGYHQYVFADPVWPAN
jgi:hypothetical protein